MEEFLKGLSESLTYISHSYVGDNDVKIVCEIKRGIAVCPYCGRASWKVNCQYKRTFKDVSFGSKKVTLEVWFNNYFCGNTDCAHGTFAEKVDFVEPFSVRTKRLDTQILELSIGNSGIGTERYIRKHLADISDTTVNRILKKNAYR